MPTKFGVNASHINPYLNFLSRFYLILFFDPIDYSPWLKREIWPNLKSSNISKTREAMPTKIGVHAFYINPYLPNLKLILSPEPERPCPPKLVCVHLTSTLTYMNF